MQFVVDSIAPPPAGETPQAALVRRGAHLVSAPEGHSLRRAVPHLFSVFNGHTVIAFNVIEGLLARVLRLPAAAPAPALARVGAGAVDLSVLESTLAILVAEPYSLSVEPVTSETFLRDVKELSSSARVRADARFVVTNANIYALGVPPPPRRRRARAPRRRPVVAVEVAREAELQQQQQQQQQRPRPRRRPLPQRRRRCRHPRSRSLSSMPSSSH